MSILKSSLTKTCKPKAPNFPISLPHLSDPSKWLSHQNLKNSNQFSQILSNTIVSGLFQDPFISSKLLSSSLSNNTKNISFSHSLFSQIQNPNIFAYNFMFKAFSNSSAPIESITLYNSMVKNGILPDNYTFPLIFKACGRLLVLDKGQELHCLSLKLGLEFDVFVQNGLISMYSLCGKIDIARMVFDKVAVFVRDVVSWNSMVSGYVQCGCDEDALKVFGDLLSYNLVRFDGVTLISALTVCGRMGVLDVGRKIHGLILRNGYVLDVFLGSALVDMYVKCGKLEDARKVFDKIPDRNLVCWTSMIVGYARINVFKEAIELFKEMQLSGIVADSALIACVISACGHMGALDRGRWLHTYCERNGIDMSLSVRNALIDMYSKCGDVDKALQIFNCLIDRDVFSWTAMISGLAMNGKAEKALDMFAEMEVSSDVRPNEVTFLGVLSACSHAGFVDKGFHYLKAMSQIHHITPRIEHYGCMVDLLGRANLVVEAESFIREMPIQPDVVIWRSLLFACRSHENIELAERASSKIEELEPRKSEAHVLLSNVYASSARWGEVHRVRRSMVRQKLQKQPGCSFIEVNSLVQEFFLEDGYHCQSNDIYETNVQIHEVLRSGRFDSDILDG